MRAQQLRTIIIARDTLEDVVAALDKLRKGQALTAVESGVQDYSAIQDVPMAGDAVPTIYFDGFRHVVTLFVAEG